MAKKILIFDDDQDILNICSIILRGKGYQVRTRGTCVDLLSVIAEFEPDVIVMDNKIPESGGVEATRLIKANLTTSHIPVVLFSANTHVAELTEQAGADLYIQKPFDLSEFEAVLEKVLHKNDLLNNQAVQKAGDLV